MEVLPVINCADKDIDEVKKRLNAAVTFADWVHLDVSDGSFTFNKSWRDAAEWKRLAPPINLEVHLMVEEPEKIVREWLDAGAKRVIFHLEAVRDMASRRRGAKIEDAVDLLRSACADHHAELALGTNPETTPEAMEQYAQDFRSLMVLAQSHPGLPGQPFLPLVLKKIARLREEYPSARIEVDGGINLETARRSREAGASAVTAGTYIFSSENPQKTYEAFRAL